MSAWPKSRPKMAFQPTAAVSQHLIKLDVLRPSKLVPAKQRPAGECIIVSVIRQWGLGKQLKSLVEITRLA